MVSRRAVDFVTQWMSENLDAGSDADVDTLAKQLEIDATVVGITRAEIEADMGPLEALVASARTSLAEAGRPPR